MCCGKKCLKVINIFFVVLLWIISMAEISGGTLMLLFTHRLNRPETLGQPIVFVPPLTMILFGIILIPSIILAGYGLCKEVSCSINLYATILIVLSFLQVAVGVYCMLHVTTKNTDLLAHIKGSFIYSFRNYKNDPRLVNTVQQTLTCCGINSPADWTNNTVPWSCCDYHTYHEKPCSMSSELLFKEGCTEASTHFILFWTSVLGYSSIGFGALEVLVALMGYYLSCGYFRKSFVI